MGNILDGTGLKKWRAQADRAAAHLKTNLSAADKAKLTLKLGFFFDDAPISIEIRTLTVMTSGHQQLADTIYEMVLAEARKLKH